MSGNPPKSKHDYKFIDNSLTLQSSVKFAKRTI
jgi:hypothetical protein